MKRMLAGLAVAAAVFAVAAPSGLSAPRTATINVVFNANGSATITSTQGVSHYVVTLCDGTTFKVELSGDSKTVTVGPFSSPIASISVKSATTTTSFVNPAGCTPPPPPPPPHRRRRRRRRRRRAPTPRAIRSSARILRSSPDA